jgi:hypothetical protein
MGHKCINKFGVILFPGAMCPSVGEINDKFYECTLPVLRQSSKAAVGAYHEALRTLLMGKEGIIRGRCCSGFVEGRLRMAILAAWGLSKNEIYQTLYCELLRFTPSS